MRAHHPYRGLFGHDTMTNLLDHSTEKPCRRMSEALPVFDAGHYRDLLAGHDAAFGHYFKADTRTARRLYAAPDLLAAHIGLSRGLQRPDWRRSTWGLKALTARGIVPKRKASGIARRLPGDLWRREGDQWVTVKPRPEDQVDIPAWFVDEALPALASAPPGVLAAALELHAAFSGKALVAGLGHFDDAAYLGGLPDQLLFASPYGRLLAGPLWEELCAECGCGPDTALEGLERVDLLALAAPELTDKGEEHRVTLRDPPRNSVLGAFLGY